MQLVKWQPKDNIHTSNHFKIAEEQLKRMADIQGRKLEQSPLQYFQTCQM